MSEYFAYISRSGGLTVKKRNGQIEFQRHLNVMKHYLGFFQAADEVAARKMAEQLRTEREGVTA